MGTICNLPAGQVVRAFLKASSSVSPPVESEVMDIALTAKGRRMLASPSMQPEG